MSSINLGYACINMELSNAPKAKRITTNRSMIKRTFKEKGLDYAELARKELKNRRGYAQGGIASIRKAS